MEAVMQKSSNVVVAKMMIRNLHLILQIHFPPMVFVIKQLMIFQVK